MYKLRAKGVNAQKGRPQLARPVYLYSDLRCRDGQCVCRESYRPLLPAKTVAEEGRVGVVCLQTSGDFYLKTWDRESLRLLPTDHAQQFISF